MQLNTDIVPIKSLYFESGSKRLTLPKLVPRADGKRGGLDIGLASLPHKNLNLYINGQEQIY